MLRHGRCGRTAPTIQEQRTNRSREQRPKQSCWASFARLQLTGEDPDVVRTVVEGHETTAYYRDGTTYVVEFMCLPDSVDPRGAKGK
jgi:hypothetical protein